MLNLSNTKRGVLIPEGRHNFTITSAMIDDNSVAVISMKTDDGYLHTERYFLVKNDGSVNDYALDNISAFIKGAMNDQSLTQFEVSDLKGKRISATIEYTTMKNDNGEERTFAHVNNLDVVGIAGGTSNDVFYDSVDNLWG